MRHSFLSLLLVCLPAFAAEKADLIVTARQVVTMDDQRRVIENGAVAVLAGRIAAVGTRAEIESRYEAVRRIDRPNALLTPGLVNTHTHAPMSLLRGIADDLALQEWLEKFIFPAENRNVNEEFVRWGTKLAMLEMMLGGTTTYTDMYYFEGAMAEETRAAGMRGVLGQTIIGFPAPDYKTPAEALAGTEKFIQRFKDDPLITPAVAPHAIYTNSKETLKSTAALADKYGVPMLIHISETKKENDDALVEFKATPTQYLEDIGGIAKRSLFAHTVWATPDDIKMFVKHHVGVAHCPGSNMKLASGSAPVVELLAAGVAVGLGPDGPAGSNNDFSMFEEMDLAGKLAKLVNRDPKALPARTVFEMATLGGARVLGMEKEIGSLDVGKRADLITVSLDAPHANPVHDPYSMLVYSLKTSDVQDVVIEGKVTVENRNALTLDAPAILKKAGEIRVRVESSLRGN